MRKLQSIRAHACTNVFDTVTYKKRTASALAFMRCKTMVMNAGVHRYRQKHVHATFVFCDAKYVRKHQGLFCHCVAACKLKAFNVAFRLT